MRAHATHKNTYLPTYLPTYTTKNVFMEFRCKKGREFVTKNQDHLQGDLRNYIKMCITSLK